MTKTTSTSLRRLFIFRHGETDWNAEGRFQGQIDVPLNDRGRAQATELISSLREAGVQAVLSSDLARARETAQIIAGALAVGVFEDAGIREAHLGHAQGLTVAEIRERFGETLDRWKSVSPTDADVSYPDGESGAAVTARSFATLERFLRANPSYERVGVATHGGVIRRVMHHLLPPGSEPVRIPNCVLYEIRFDLNSGGFVLS